MSRMSRSNLATSGREVEVVDAEFARLAQHVVVDVVTFARSAFRVRRRAVVAGEDRSRDRRSVAEVRRVIGVMPQL